ncbi:hypothetical protein BD414DRAFT_282931 [Trametes punicea]|nr:hypothetical protein BD414DRAFT_282931 [Trametes punicea]
MRAGIVSAHDIACSNPYVFPVLTHAIRLGWGQSAGLPRGSKVPILSSAGSANMANDSLAATRLPLQCIAISLAIELALRVTSRPGSSPTDHRTLGEDASKCRFADGHGST